MSNGQSDYSRKQVVVSLDGAREKRSDHGGSTSYGGGGEPIVDAETLRYVDKSMEAVRAQNDARFAEVLAQLRKLNDIPTFGKMVLTAVGVGVGGVTLIIGVLAFGGDRFDGGVQISSVSVQQAEEARQIAKENADRVKELDQKLETLIGLIRERVNQ